MSHVDSFVYYNGAPTSTITNLWHLNGVTLGVIADGVYVPDKTVSNGSLTLSTPASVVYAGIVYSGYIKILKNEQPDDAGDTDGLVRRVISITANVYNSGKFKFGPDETENTQSIASITAITKTNPGQVTTGAAHGLLNGNKVMIKDVAGMTQVNNHEYIVSNKAPTTFELKDINGIDVDTSSYSTYTSGGKIYKIVSNYLDDSLWCDQDPSSQTVLHTGDAIDSGFPGRYDRTGKVVLYQNNPYPLIIRSVTQEIIYGKK